MVDPSDTAWEHVLWRKSSKSASNGCVEVAHVTGKVAVRDSKNREGPILLFTPIEWDAFLSGVRSGEFDLTALP
jgi:hypothetical protein